MTRENVGSAAHVVIRDVSFRYPAGGGRNSHPPLLSNLSFEIQPGELAAVVGRSGCGKTTLLGLLAGFLPCREGDILIDGRRVAGPSPDRTVILQEHNLLPWLSAAGNVMLPMRARHVPRRQARRRAQELLELVDMAAFASYYPSRLSGGMRQRVAFARALAANPRLILMDEPFASLDWVSRRELQRELVALLEGGRRTVVIVTHDLDEALYLADRIYVLSQPPTSLVCELEVDIARPRDGASERALRVLELKTWLLAQLEQPAASGGSSR